jgi:hypothetical protein
MWRRNEPVEEDVSDLPGIDPHSKRRRAWRDGLADQTVVKTLEHVRSYRTFERTLIGSIDPRSVIELALVHRHFVVPAQSKRVSLRPRANFCLRASRTRPADPVKRGRSKLPPGPMAIAKALARTDETIRRSATTTTRFQRPCGRPRVDGRSPAPSPNVSCASPILTRLCLTAWAATKRDYGARQRKRFGPSRRCDSRRLQCGSGCATGSRPSPGIGRGRSRLPHCLDVDCSRLTRVASAAVHCVNQWRLGE